MKLQILALLILLSLTACGSTAPMQQCQTISKPSLFGAHVLGERPKCISWAKAPENKNVAVRASEWLEKQLTMERVMSKATAGIW